MLCNFMKGKIDLLIRATSIMLFSACFQKGDKHSLNLAKKYFEKLQFCKKFQESINILDVKTVSFITAHALKLGIPKAGVHYLDQIPDIGDFAIFNLKLRTALALKDDRALLTLIKLAIEREYSQAILTSSRSNELKQPWPERLALDSSPNPWSKPFSDTKMTCEGEDQQSNPHITGILCPETYKMVVQYVEDAATALQTKERFSQLRMVIEKMVKSKTALPDAYGCKEETRIIEPKYTVEDYLKWPIDFDLP